MSFPDSIGDHRRAVLEMLTESFRDPAKTSLLRTRGISMLPFLRDGDEIGVRGLDPRTLAVGSIVAFRAGDLLLVHRVAAIAGRDGQQKLWERGDNNMYMTVVAGSRLLGQVFEVRLGHRRLDLDARRFRLVGLLVALHGRLAVKLYDRIRRIGRRLLRPGSAGSQAARRVIYALLLAPSRALLIFARRLL